MSRPSRRLPRPLPRRVLALLLLVTPLTACFSVHHSYHGQKLLTSDASVPGMHVHKVHHFARHDRQFYWLHGGFPVGEDLNGAELAAAQIGSHDAVVNLKISDGQDLPDMFVSHILCGLSLLCGTWSVWAEGDVADLEASR